MEVWSDDFQHLSTDIRDAASSLEIERRTSDAGGPQTM